MITTTRGRELTHIRFNVPGILAAADSITIADLNAYADREGIPATVLLKHPKARVEAVLGKSLDTADRDNIAGADVAHLVAAFPTLAYSDVAIAEWARLPECCDACTLAEDACIDAWCGCHKGTIR